MFGDLMLPTFRIAAHNQRDIWMWWWTTQGFLLWTKYVDIGILYVLEWSAVVTVTEEEINSVKKGKMIPEKYMVYKRSSNVLMILKRVLAFMH